MDISISQAQCPITIFNSTILDTLGMFDGTMPILRTQIPNAVLSSYISRTPFKTATPTAMFVAVRIEGIPVQFLNCQAHLLLAVGYFAILFLQCYL